ncbi:MAG TPA: hypothetical protein VGG14_17735 [Candidatus Sulfotelmatobacter sp.]
MRTNITLDDDVHQFAQIYARAKGITLSAAISELVRRAQDTQLPVPEVRRSAITGLATFPSSGRKLTSKMVHEAESDPA